MNDDQAPSLPLPFPRTSQWHGPLADLEAAMVPIREQIADLERDYAPRDGEFWEATLGMVPVLHQALQPFILWITSNDALDTIEQMNTRYALMIPIYHLQDQIDTIGIRMTAYLPKCKSYLQRNLEERHFLLKKLQELCTIAQNVTNVAMTMEDTGGHRS